MNDQRKTKDRHPFDQVPRSQWTRSDWAAHDRFMGACHDKRDLQYCPKCGNPAPCENYGPGCP